MKCLTLPQLLHFWFFGFCFYNKLRLVVLLHHIENNLFVVNNFYFVGFAGFGNVVLACVDIFAFPVIVCEGDEASSIAWVIYPTLLNVNSGSVSSRLLNFDDKHEQTIWSLMLLSTFAWNFLNASDWIMTWFSVVFNIHEWQQLWKISDDFCRLQNINIFLLSIPNEKKIVYHSGSTIWQNPAWNRKACAKILCQNKNLLHFFWNSTKICCRKNSPKTLCGSECVCANFIKNFSDYFPWLRTCNDLTSLQNL